MTKKGTDEKDYILVDRSGKPLTQIEIKFIETIRRVSKKHGTGVLLALYTLMEASLK